VTDPAGAPSVSETWDEGLAPERTELAWGRTGLAVLAAVGVLARRVWLIGGWIEIAALVVIGAGGVVWLIGMGRSRDLHLTMVPHGLQGRLAFGMVTAGTLLLATGGLVIGITLPS
jgi:uncharacterized membrane protein YidH (DUF202 family)